MNALYNQALRQFSSIQGDLGRVESEGATAASMGTITASLGALVRTIDEYESLAKRELIQSKQDKAFGRVAKFRSDYRDLQARMQSLPAQHHHQQNHAYSSARPAESPFQLHARNNNPDPLAAYRMNDSAAAMFAPTNPREAHALREHSFIQHTEAQLDAFISQGREVLGNLVEQRGILKGTQRRLLDAANTMGLSRNVIVRPFFLSPLCVFQSVSLLTCPFLRSLGLH